MTSSDTQRVQQGVPPLDWARQAGEADLLRQEIASRLQAKRKRTVRRIKQSSAVLLLAGILSWAIPLARSTSSVETAAGKRQTLTLSDGSSAELNARTSIKTDFRYGRRRVALERGEVFFSVAKDSQHPFLVETPRGVVRVTGTRFNVRVDGDGHAWVTLVEGSVQAASKSREIALQPSQQLELTDTPSPPHNLAPEQIEQVLAWRTGRLILDGLTLGAATQRFADYHGKAIEVAAEVEKFPVGGRARLDDLEGFLEFLSKGFPVKVLSEGNGYRIVSAPEKNL